MITAGIDIGSITSKAVLMKDMKVLGFDVISTGYNSEKSGKEVLNLVLDKCFVNIEETDSIISTGYGRNRLSFAHKKITEITCHAAGAHFQDKKIRSVIDIGGQDSKVIILDENGSVTDFAMNDKCAAGTGRFLEVMARALELDLNDFGDISAKAKKAAHISSLCTVFAESEIISLISAGEKRENIIRGIHESIGTRVGALALRAGLRSPVMMTGGVSRNTGVVRSLESRLGVSINVSSYAQVNGALGAACLGFR